MSEESKINKEMNYLIAERKLNEVIAKAEELTDEYSDWYLGYWWIARAYTLMGDTEAALDYLMDAMKHAEDEKEESKISSSIANVHNIKKEWEEAINYTDIALELNPENVVAIIARSIALSATGDKKKAARLLDDHGRLFKEEYQKACVAAIKRDKAKMLEHLANAFKDNPHQRVTVLYDPDFAPYVKDSEFRALLKA